MRFGLFGSLRKIQCDSVIHNHLVPALSPGGSTILLSEIIAL